MNRKKMALWGLLAVFAGFVAWTALSIPEPPAPIPESERKPKEMEYGENTIREEIGGRLLWELTTSSTKMNVDTQATTFKDAKGKYCFEDGRVLTLTAAAGSYDSKTKNLKLTDGVQASLSDIHARMPPVRPDRVITAAASPSGAWDFTSEVTITFAPAAELTVTISDSSLSMFIR